MPRTRADRATLAARGVWAARATRGVRATLAARGVRGGTRGARWRLVRYAHPGTSLGLTRIARQNGEPGPRALRMTYFELVFGGYREPPTKRLPILGVGELIFVNFCCVPETRSGEQRAAPGPAVNAKRTAAHADHESAAASAVSARPKAGTLRRRTRPPGSAYARPWGSAG